MMLLLSYIKILTELIFLLETLKSAFIAYPLCFNLSSNGKTELQNVRSF